MTHIEILTFQLKKEPFSVIQYSNYAKIRTLEVNDAHFTKDEKCSSYSKYSSNTIVFKDIKNSCPIKKNLSFFFNF